jgi:hypothetical protein
MIGCQDKVVRTVQVNPVVTKAVKIVLVAKMVLAVRIVLVVRIVQAGIVLVKVANKIPVQVLIRELIQVLTRALAVIKILAPIKVPVPNKPLVLNKPRVLKTLLPKVVKNLVLKNQLVIPMNS